MENNTVIKVEGIKKKFCRNLKKILYYGSIDIFRDIIGIPYRADILRPEEFWALNDINFEVKKGDAIGIVGTNGSGKTTLLRLLDGIFPPDHGKISIKGKVGALIAVGAGFHPHMSGRENIYLNGTILGMKRKEIDKKIESIIDFADIDKFIDAPVSTYSSGMTVRLGFSIAIHSDPDILLADEVLAVGDLGFALKCYGRINKFKDEGGTILLVSHSLQLVRNTCMKTIWLNRGKIEYFGDTQEACNKFEKAINNEYVEHNNRNKDERILNYDKKTRITNVEFLDLKDKIKSEFDSGDNIKIRIHYKCDRQVSNPIFTVSILTADNNIQVISNYSNFDGLDIKSIKGEGYVDFVFGSVKLKPTIYSCLVTFTENNINNILEWHDKNYTFSVGHSDNTFYGLIDPNPKWTHVASQ